MLLNLLATVVLQQSTADEPKLLFEKPEVQSVLGEAYGHALDNFLCINVLKATKHEARSGRLSEGDPFMRAGGDYQEPWTRDASVNSWNAVSLIKPTLARNTLWAVCEKSTDGRVTVQNDNQWWDKVIWVIAAWDNYATTGDKGFLSLAHKTTEALLNELIKERFDKEYGLFTGPSHLQDGIAGYPPPFDDPAGTSSFILDHPGSREIMTLSVNCLYHKAFLSMASMCEVLGKDDKPWKARATALKKAINDKLWMPESGSYAYMLFGAGDLRGKQAKYQEATGISLAVLCGVADSKRATEVVKNAKTTKFGIPLVEPEFSRYSLEKPGRHSRIVWPMAQGYWGEAAAKVGNIERFRSEVDILAELAKSTDWNFYEIYNPTTGKPDGGWQSGGHWGSCTNQTWSATAYVRMIHRGLYGMEFKPEGIVLNPTLPKEWGGVTLSGLHYRQAVLNIHLSGAGRKVSKFEIDGKPAEKQLVPGALKGEHIIEITLK